MRARRGGQGVLWLALAGGVFAGAQVTQPPQTTVQQPMLFGTNTDVNNASESKGAELGLVDSDEKPVKKKGELAIAPIPMVNPSIGNGAGLSMLYARKLGGAGDTSPPSSFGGGGFGTGNGSWGLGLGARLFLKNDRYRITIGSGGGKYNYNYFGTGNSSGASEKSIPLSQRSKAFLVEPKIRVYKEWFVGPRYHIISNNVSLNNPKLDLNNLPVALPDGLKLRTAALGIRIQRDTSDSKFYPRSGSVFDTLIDFYGSGVGGKRTYQNVVFTYDKYISAGAKNVFAFHGKACLTTDKAPFYDLCELGRSTDIRGYQVGQFRDDRMLVGQAEYRRELFWRLGAVAFAGAGAVATTWGGFGDSDARPGGGFGLRFVMAKRNHINLRADYAWGEGTHATYVGLNEAF